MNALVKVLTAQRQHVDVAQTDCSMIPRRCPVFHCSLAFRLPAALSCSVQQGELESHEATGTQHPPAAGDAAALYYEDVGARVASTEHSLEGACAAFPVTA